MHRRDIELIAKVLRECRQAYVETVPIATVNKVAVQATEVVAKEMCHALKAENPSFRDDLFIRACGIPQ